MSGLVTPEYVFVNLEATTPQEVFEGMGGALRTGGMVTDGYVDALAAREENYPTGLPVGCGVAIPHTDAKYVIHDAIAVATLAHPVSFEGMGGGEDVAVSLVFMLVLGHDQNHVAVLKRVIQGIQDKTFLDSVSATTDADEIARLASAKFEQE